jgi:hypothetical protein
MGNKVSNGIINLECHEPVLFGIAPSDDLLEENKVGKSIPEMNMRLEAYVQLRGVSAELQEMIRKELACSRIKLI